MICLLKVNGLNFLMCNQAINIRNIRNINQTTISIIFLPYSNFPIFLKPKYIKIAGSQPTLYDNKKFENSDQQRLAKLKRIKQ